MRIKDTNTGTRRISGQSLAGRKTRDLLASEDSTVAMPTVSVVVAPASSITQTVKDATSTTNTTATTLTTTDVNVTVPSGGYSAGPVTYSSSNPAVATIDSAGNVTPVSAGTTIITATIPGLNNRQVALAVTQTGGVVTTVLDAFVTGSLGAHLVAQIQGTGGLIGSQTPPAGLPEVHPPPAFSVLNIYNADGTRNTGVWTGSLNLTCIPQSGEGVLIAPDTVAFAAHVGTPPSTLTFVDNSGGTHTATVSRYTDVSSAAGDGGDIRIGQLGSALPSSITPALLMPGNFRSYLPQPQFGYPLLFTNQDKTLLLGDLVAVQATTPFGLVEAQSADAARAPWWYAIRVGDSGNPVFHVIDVGRGLGKQLVLATLWHRIFAPPPTASGPIYADNITQINAAMSANHSTHTVTTVDLSGFTAY